MSNANLLISTIIFLLCSAPSLSWSDEKGLEPVSEVKNFQAHMLDHPYAGCPTNSLCSKKVGELRAKWLSIIKKGSFKSADTFRQKNGMPLKIWTRDSVLNDPNLILWDSFCPKHKPKQNSEGLINTDNQIFIAEAWSKDFTDVLDKYKSPEKVLFNKVYLLDEKGKTTSYLIPREESPLLINDKKLYFTVEEEGSYYGFWVSPDGKVKVANTITPKNFPKSVSCPKDLTKAFKDGQQNKNLFEGAFCKALWNQSTKKYNTVIIGWSCN